MSKYYSHVESTPTDMEWIPDYMEADPEYQSHKRRRLDGSATRWYNAPAFTE